MKHFKPYIKAIGKVFIVFMVAMYTYVNAYTQDMTPLVLKVKAKLDQVNSYTADGVMKTDIVFIKAPISKVKVFYKKPNTFKLERSGGISLLPKGGVSINMSNMLATTNFTAFAAGEETIKGVKVRVVKLIPMSESSDVVLTTMYIDEANLLIMKAVTTTKENGTYEMEMTYGKFANYGLPDKVVFSFNTKDYKLPKGITLEFEEGAKPNDANLLKNKKGRVTINYFNYVVN